MMRPLLFLASIGVAAVSLSSCKSAAPPVGQSPQVTLANELAAQARLRSIATAEAAHQADSGVYATLDELIERELLADPARGKLSSYKFEVRLHPNGFEATAVPEKFGISGRRSFYIDETNVIRGAEKGGAPATASDPAL
ncbi:MAG TPA: hypothetical protein VJH03_27230 [Blastocatellia bacterium]|nr:hypothetical protein [Blastocatellia bacterium]